MNNPYVYDPKNPIKSMATRVSKRNEKLARAISMVGDVVTTVCLAVGFYALVGFIFGVTA